jgi:hypothetical protein
MKSFSLIFKWLHNSLILREKDCMLTVVRTINPVYLYLTNFNKMTQITKPQVLPETGAFMKLTEVHKFLQNVLNIDMLVPLIDAMYTMCPRYMDMQSGILYYDCESLKDCIYGGIYNEMQVEVTTYVRPQPPAYWGEMTESQRHAFAAAPYVLS